MKKKQSKRTEKVIKEMNAILEKHLEQFTPKECARLHKKATKTLAVHKDGVVRPLANLAKLIRHKRKKAGK